MVFSKKKKGNPSFGNRLVGLDQDIVGALLKGQLPSFLIAHTYWRRLGLGDTKLEKIQKILEKLRFGLMSCAYMKRGGPPYLGQNIRFLKCIYLL